MKVTTHRKILGAALLALVWVLPSSGDMSSDSYIVHTQIIDSGGSQSASTGYMNLGAAGQTTPIGLSQSSSYRIRAGYIAQVAGLKHCWDRDGDRFFDEACGGDDCDDTDFDINPGAQEGPPYDATCTDGIDNDCDGLIDADDEADCVCVDIDGDGHTDETCGGTDCDDTDPDVNPDQIEICDNGIDDDCDGSLDWYDFADCFAPYILELDADYMYSYLILNYRIGNIESVTWTNYLILTSPSVQVIPLWSISLPAQYPPIDIPISFPFPSLGLIGIYTGLYTAGSPQEVQLVWVNT